MFKRIEDARDFPAKKWRLCLTTLYIQMNRIEPFRVGVVSTAANLT